jgi:hypothetical protein
MSNLASLPLTVSDLVCEFDLDPLGGETTSDLQSLGQDILHILLEAPGTNPDDPDRGIGVEGMLSGTNVNLTNSATIIDSQLRKDDRIQSSKTTLTVDANGVYTLNLQVLPIGAVLPQSLNFTYSASTGVAPA